MMGSLKLAALDSSISRTCWSILQWLACWQYAHVLKNMHRVCVRGNRVAYDVFKAGRPRKKGEATTRHALMLSFLQQ